MKNNIYTGVALIGLIALGTGVMFLRDKEDETVKIGVIAPLTGIVAAYGEEIKKGVESADISGVSVVFEDDQCDPKLAVNAFRKLTELDGVRFIIGPACGSSQEAIVPLLKDKEILVLVPAAASQKLFEQSGGNFFNMQYSLEDESTFLAGKMYERGLRNVILISYQNAFSKTHRDTFVANFKGTIVKEIIYVDATSDVSSELVKIKDLPHDAIFSTDISFFFANGLEKLRQFGIITPVFSQYAVELPAVRSLVEGVAYSFPDDISESEGAARSLARESADLMVKLVTQCEGVYLCVKSNLAQNGFVNGVKQRELVLKEIKNASPTRVE